MHHKAEKILHVSVSLHRILAGLEFTVYKNFRTSGMVATFGFGLTGLRGLGLIFLTAVADCIFAGRWAHCEIQENSFINTLYKTEVNHGG